MMVNRAVHVHCHLLFHLLTVERFLLVSSCRMFTCSINLSLTCTFLMSRFFISDVGDNDTGLEPALTLETIVLSTDASRQ